jgi:hypothetical protein
VINDLSAVSGEKNIAINEKNVSSEDDKLIEAIIS